MEGPLRAVVVQIMRWILVLVLVLASCAGSAARVESLLPALRLAWPYIVRNVEGSMPSERVADLARRMGRALESGDVVDGWEVLERAALLGIDVRLARGEIGPGVAESLRERVRMFGVAYRVLVGT